MFASINLKDANDINKSFINEMKIILRKNLVNLKGEFK